MNRNKDVDPTFSSRWYSHSALIMFCFWFAHNSENHSDKCEIISQPRRPPERLSLPESTSPFALLRWADRPAASAWRKRPENDGDNRAQVGQEATLDLPGDLPHRHCLLAFHHHRRSRHPLRHTKDRWVLRMKGPWGGGGVGWIEERQRWVQLGFFFFFLREPRSEEAASCDQNAIFRSHSAWKARFCFPERHNAEWTRSVCTCNRPSVPAPVLG